jgi:methionyl-tRNA formyltransferase
MASGIKYFYLAHGVMGLKCLAHLCSRDILPEYVFIHKNREFEKLKESFYEPVEKLSSMFNLNLIKVDKISEYRNKIAECNLGICVGFMEILTKNIFELPRLGILNLHCGKLPEYKGRAPISRAIIKGDEHIIMTLHKIDEGVDSGDILSEIALTVEEKDDVNSLYDKCCEYAGRFVYDNLSLINKFGLYENTVNYNNLFVKQFPPGIEPNKRISDEERKIDWKNDAVNIHNLVRALALPYPSPYFLFRNKKYFLLKSSIRESETVTNKAGKILKAGSDGMEIACGKGIILAEKISDENGKLIHIEKEFKTGDKLQ